MMAKLPGTQTVEVEVSRRLKLWKATEVEAMGNGRARRRRPFQPSSQTGAKKREARAKKTFLKLFSSSFLLLLHVCEISNQITVPPEAFTSLSVPCFTVITCIIIEERKMMMMSKDHLHIKQKRKPQDRASISGHSDKIAFSGLVGFD